jgi:hypothetical protein
MLPTAGLKEWEKIRPYRDSIPELVFQVHVQEARHDTVNFKSYGILVYVEVSLKMHLFMDIARK